MENEPLMRFLHGHATTHRGPRLVGKFGFSSLSGQLNGEGKERRAHRLVGGRIFPGQSGH